MAMPGLALGTGRSAATVHLPVIGLLLCALCRLSASLNPTLDDGGTQFIFYNGTMSGSFVHNTPAISHPNATVCGDGGVYYFSDLANAGLRIGVNPPWDTNPFFFQLDRHGSTSISSPPVENRIQAFVRPFGGPGNICSSAVGCTHDAIYNLYLATTYYLCYKDGKPCGSSIFSPRAYITKPMLNITAASVSHVSGVPLAEDDPGPFYAVQGDEQTALYNGTSDYNDFSFQRPWNYSDATQGKDCADDIHFANSWSSKTAFTYALNFTNTTATAKLTFSSTLGNVTLLFSGRRQDGDNPSLEPNNFVFEYSAIALANPADHELPKFTFGNGSDFTFTEMLESTKLG
ncbi:hypothetical protein B0T24DRAFT_597903 [Lasiosphaeria ovina]|uniref:Uncharacterized protein n=1 Tax=Lasiosphaeria ovina TaxID=92902 RepID=A0AAE0JXH2_9PEZI|nr:hypothetical protein B0T24DRAFT_597903 [Lasiosphaeria ovina]